MKIKLPILDIHRIWIVLYTFIAVFEPPFLPVGSIYFIGILTLFLIRFKISVDVLKKSKMYPFLKLILFLFVYLLIITLIDSIFIESKDLLSNRLRCINQLLVLTSVQLLNIYYIITYSQKYEYTFQEMFRLIIYAGIIQGCLAVVAFVSPTIRAYFLRNMSSVFDSEWTLQRRGYGFSQVLLDTFGYGMALLSGYLLLTKSKIKIAGIISFLLMTFAIFMNARTGIIVLFIAIIIYFLKANNLLTGILKILLTSVFLVTIYLFVLPWFINWASNCNSYTIKWIANPISEIFGVISGGGKTTDLETLSFISNIINLPQNIFELIFGSGHSVYGTKIVLGFSTDIGYYNMIWIYGIFGTILWYIMMIYLFFNAFQSAKDKNYKSICLFILISYFVVQIKANLLGYNPGTFITYFTIFLICFCGESKININT